MYPYTHGARAFNRRHSTKCGRRFAVRVSRTAYCNRSVVLCVNNASDRLHYNMYSVLYGDRQSGVRCPPVQNSGSWATRSYLIKRKLTVTALNIVFRFTNIRSRFPTLQVSKGALPFSKWTPSRSGIVLMIKRRVFLSFDKYNVACTPKLSI